MFALDGVKAGPPPVAVELTAIVDAESFSVKLVFVPGMKNALTEL